MSKLLLRSIATRSESVRLPRLQKRCLHASASTLYATPVNHPHVVGPPPQPPRASVDQPEEVAARKRKQAELLQRGQALKVNPSQPSSALKKRFWKDVSVKETDDGLQIMLDSKPVRTASKRVLTLPSRRRALATAIAMEWDLLVSSQQALKQHYIPLTSLTSRAVDIEIADSQGEETVRENIVNMAMRYLRTDTLLCWAPQKGHHDPTGMSGESNIPGPSLREKQKLIAEPIIAHLKKHVFTGVEIEPVLGADSILPRSQPEATQQVAKGWIHGLPPFELAALERGILATKSLLIATRLLVEWSHEFRHLHASPESPKFGIQDAAKASSVEVTWQTDMWGEVEDTHDVEKEDLARQLGSVVLLVN